MTASIATVLKRLLAGGTPADVITHLGGLVCAQTIQATATFGQNSTLKVPVEVDRTDQDYHYLVPDQAKRCIVYFEPGLERPNRGQTGVAKKAFAALSLVCWFNATLFESVTPGELSGQLAHLFTDVLAGTLNSPSRSTPFSFLSVTVTGLEEFGPATFSRYTYDEQVSGYLNAPYGYFRLDLGVDFLPLACPVAPKPLTPSC